MGLGGLIGVLFKKNSNKTMSLLLSFAAGIMLSVVFFDLIPEGINVINKYNVVISNIIVIASIILGVVIIYILNNLIDKYSEKRSEHIDENHPKTHDDISELIHSDHYTEALKQNKDKASLLKAGTVMIIAIALHSFPEGMSIGTSLAMSIKSGVLMAILLGLHHIPEGMAIVAPLYSGGIKKSKAVIITALSGFPILLGALVGYFIGESGPLGLSISLGLTSGAMIYIVFFEILPQSTLMYKSKKPAFFVIAGLLSGKILMEVIIYIASFI